MKLENRYNGVNYTIETIYLLQRLCEKERLIFDCVIYLASEKISFSRVKARYKSKDELTIMVDEIVTEIRSIIEESLLVEAYKELRGMGFSHGD